MDTYQAPLNLANLINKFVMLRDHKREMEAQHKAALKPVDQLMDEIGSILLSHMQETGVEHVATSGGTAYQTTRRSATIRDGEAFKQYVVEQQMFELLDWKANANAAFKHIEDFKTAPPGLSVSSMTKINVRKPNEKE